MASVSFTFNLEAVAPSAKQGTKSAGAESSTAIGAKYDSVQTSVQGASHVSGLNSPACVGGDCFVVHGEGPGVTTLSAGEEEGVSGDFITLPVIDGSLFLEPPIADFTGGAEYDITTLAIGEEDGGVAAAAPEIGSSSAEIAEAGFIEPRFTMEPIYDSEPSAQIASSQVASAPVGAIQTTPIVMPNPTPINAGASVEAVQFATANSPLPPIQTVPILEPRAKPVELAETSFPVPDAKPDAIFASVGTSGSAAAPANVQAGTNLVSVGDYDAYLASMGKGASSEQVAGNVGTAAEPLATASYVPPPLAPIQPLNSGSVTAQVASPVYVPPPLAPIEPFNLSPVGADSVTVSYRPPPLAPIETFNFSPVGTETTTATYSPPAPTAVAPVETAIPIAGSATLPIGAIETSASPRIKPASFTTQEPVTLAPIQTVPIEVEVALPSQVQLDGNSTISSQTQFGAEPGSTFATVDAPIPAGKPEGVGTEAPRLSDEDFRITTLALGEEDAGGN